MRNKDEHGMAFVFWAEGAYRVKGDISGAIEVVQKNHRAFSAQ